MLLCCFFFFKQKTAYELRISDWSSDVCSSDLSSRPNGRAGRALFSGGSIGVRDRFHRLYAFGRGGNDLAKAREEFAGELPCRPVNEARPELGQLAADVGLHLEVQHREDRKSTRLNSSH